MKVKASLFFLSLVIFLLFVGFSYTVAKELWQQVDFDLTVKLQDRLPRKFDEPFSYLSLMGSVEVTVGLAGLLALFSLLRRRLLSFIGWLIIVPASMVEVAGKLLLFHPGTPVLFHRNVLETDLPSFYVHTNFSYPSGHMTRTTFLITVFMMLVLVNSKNLLIKLVVVGILLLMTWLIFISRIYLGEHWFSDVVGGVLLGVSTGLFGSILIIRQSSSSIG